MFELTLAVEVLIIWEPSSSRPTLNLRSSSGVRPNFLAVRPEIDGAKLTAPYTQWLHFKKSIKYQFSALPFDVDFLNRPLFQGWTGDNRLIDWRILKITLLCELSKVTTWQKKFHFWPKILKYRISEKNISIRYFSTLSVSTWNKTISNVYFEFQVIHQKV